LKHHSFDSKSRWALHKDDAKAAFLEEIMRTEVGISSDKEKDCFRFLSENDSYRFSQHYLRYFLTLRSVMEHMPSVEKMSILETGGASPILDFFSQNNETYTSTSDLRVGIDAPTEAMDVVFSFEVLEHIKDQPEKTFDEIVLFQNSGVKCFASEVTRVLKPGGLCFLSTPNPVSLLCFKRIIDGEPPAVFRPHVREYSRAEVESLFSGLELVHYETFFAFFLVRKAARLRLIEAFERAGGNPAYAGDDHFFVFQKSTAQV
jgi:SAM-dependent methyltransferase